MLLVESLSKKTHYEILGVRQKARYEEIRASYRSSILDTHPDKLQKAQDASLSIQDSENRFLDVQKAWEILSDPKSRFAYDCELLAFKNDFVDAEYVCLEDLTIETADDDLALIYQCRCGDYFSICSSELEDMGYKLSMDDNKASICITNELPSSVLLPCSSCSLYIRLLINS